MGNVDASSVLGSMDELLFPNQTNLLYENIWNREKFLELCNELWMSEKLISYTSLMDERVQMKVVVDAFFGDYFWKIKKKYFKHVINKK